MSKTHFERLVAELFARRGFEVDLFRASQDDGIDFLAVKGGTSQPLVMAVQTKHPDPAGKSGKRSTLPVATIREIYGVAKAWNLSGAIAVTSAGYSNAAKKFTDLKPAEMKIHDSKDLLSWLRQYRWNQDE